MPIYTYTTLDDPLAVGLHTFALGINSTGQIVGQYLNNGGYHGFLLSSSTYTPIDDPLARGVTSAYGINDAGQIVGYYNESRGNHGFLLSNGTNTTPPDAPTTNGITAALNTASAEPTGYCNKENDSQYADLP